MVGDAAAAAGRLEDQPELLAHAVLADDLVEGARPQRRLDGALVALGLRRGQRAEVLGLVGREVVGGLHVRPCSACAGRRGATSRPAGRRRPRARPPRRRASASLADQPRPTRAWSTWSLQGAGALAGVPALTWPDGSAEPVLELEDDPLRALLADAGDPGEGLDVVGGDGHAQRRRARGTASIAWASLGPTPDAVCTSSKHGLLVLVEEAEEGQRVLADDHARRQGGGLAGAQRGERARRAHQLEADAARPRARRC